MTREELIKELRKLPKGTEITVVSSVDFARYTPVKFVQFLEVIPEISITGCTCGYWDKSSAPVHDTHDSPQPEKVAVLYD